MKLWNWLKSLFIKPKALPQPNDYLKGEAEILRRQRASRPEELYDFLKGLPEGEARVVSQEVIDEFIYPVNSEFNDMCLVACGCRPEKTQKERVLEIAERLGYTAQQEYRFDEHRKVWLFYNPRKEKPRVVPLRPLPSPEELFSRTGEKGDIECG